MPIFILADGRNAVRGDTIASMGMFDRGADRAGLSLVSVGLFALAPLAFIVFWNGRDKGSDAITHPFSETEKAQAMENLSVNNTEYRQTHPEPSETVKLEILGSLNNK